MESTIHQAEPLTPQKIRQDAVKVEPQISGLKSLHEEIRDEIKKHPALYRRIERKAESLVSLMLDKYSLEYVVKWMKDYLDSRRFFALLADDEVNVRMLPYDDKVEFGKRLRRQEYNNALNVGVAKKIFTFSAINATEEKNIKMRKYIEYCKMRNNFSEEEFKKALPYLTFEEVFDLYHKFTEQAKNILGNGNENLISYFDNKQSTIKSSGDMLRRAMLGGLYRDGENADVEDCIERIDKYLDQNLEGSNLLMNFSAEIDNVIERGIPFKPSPGMDKDQIKEFESLNCYPKEQFEYKLSCICNELEAEAKTKVTSDILKTIENKYHKEFFAENYINDWKNNINPREESEIQRIPKIMEIKQTESIYDGNFDAVESIYDGNFNTPGSGKGVMPGVRCAESIIVDDIRVNLVTPNDQEESKNDINPSWTTNAPSNPPSNTPLQAPQIEQNVYKTPQYDHPYFKSEIDPEGTRDMQFRRKNEDTKHPEETQDLANRCVEPKNKAKSALL